LKHCACDPPQVSDNGALLPSRGTASAQPVAVSSQTVTKLLWADLAARHDTLAAVNSIIVRPLKLDTSCNGDASIPILIGMAWI
jgi:hypothetical protein